MKKILFAIFLFLIVFNVKALKCEYKIDHNNVGLVVSVGNDRGINASLSGGVYLMPGRTNDIGDFIKLTKTSSCPPKAYYACGANKYCKINTSYFVDNNAVLYGVLELKSQSQGDVHGSSNDDGGHATVITVIEDIKNGNGCEAIKGLEDLIDETIKMPLIILGAVLFLIFTTLEYAKVVFSTDASPKKANENTLKRALAFGILALSPFIIELLLSIVEISAC
ncbi:MAG: hypothetical protein J6X02_02145 [Bacilli bacterium]|nr:hypothetical protein [Bacilli bacterium]